MGVALVQLRSPFASSPDRRPEARIHEHAQPPRLEWINARASDIERRNKASALLRQLASKPPNVVVFPEYSVLGGCWSLFQAFAEEHKCIVVGGTVYDESRGPTFRENICTIFLPNGNEVRIGKRNGFREEHRALSEKPRLPSVARLICTDPDDQTFSISVFICRDYLIPYRVANRNMVSVLDWDNPGLNVVVMCSPHVSLFKGMAALDLRRMRGQGKFVALCNCSEAAPDGAPAEGSALLGPSRRLRGEGDDTIEELPGDKEGVILATLDLTRVEVRDTRPNLSSHDPVKSAETVWVDSWENFQDIHLKGVRRPRLQERGVWRPAFLEAIEREMQVHLLVAKGNVLDLKEQLPDKLHQVTAALLRGQHDLMIHRYCPSNASIQMGPPYCMQTTASFYAMFEPDTRVTVSIRPRDFFKYRFVVIEQLSDEEWNAAVTRMRQILQGPRDDIVQQASRLARRWSEEDASAVDPALLKQIFYEEREETPPISPDGSTTLRQTYVLIKIESRGDNQVDRFRDLVLPWLVRLKEVRSAYRVQRRDGPNWDFWIDIVAEPKRTDKIILELFGKSRREGINIGTRSMDVVERLTAESVDGVERGNWGNAIQKFFDMIEKVYRIREFSLIDISPGRVESDFLVAGECAQACLDGVQNAAPENKIHIVRYFAGLFSGNFTQSHDIKERQLTFAGSAFMTMYGMIEKRADELLVARFGVNETIRKLAAHLSAAQVSTGPADQTAARRPDRSETYHQNHVKALVEYLAFEKRSGRAFLPSDFDQFKRIVEHLYDLRRMVHALGHLVDLDLSHARHAPRPILDTLRQLIEGVQNVEWALTFVLALPADLFRPPPTTEPA